MKWEVYQYYMSNGGFGKVFLIMFMFSISQGIVIFNDFWLGYWSTNQFDRMPLFYIIGYLILGLLTAILVYFKGLVVGLFIKKAGVALQLKMVTAIFKSTMGWFDVTPSGRILARTNKDQDDIDVSLPMTLNFCLSNIYSILGYLVTVSIIFPYFLIVFFLLGVIYVIVVKRYLNVAREFKRIEVFIII